MNSIKKKILGKTPWITSPKVLLDISVSICYIWKIYLGSSKSSCFLEAFVRTET